MGKIRYHAIIHAYKDTIMQKVRVRFAPSPTGSLHVGGARTALYNYLYANQQGGDFIIRIEDTDTARSTQASLDSLITDLQWLGITATEGYGSTQDGIPGQYGPYRQSERLAIYQIYAQQLLEAGHAYYCFLTDAEIDAQKAAAEAQSLPYQIKSPYRDLPLAEAQKKLSSHPEATIRFKVPHEVKNYHIEDIVRGTVTLPSSMVGDFVILRSGGMPVYNFCCAIDDSLMHITHVLRGEEHLSNTLRQLMILEALSLPTPTFGHLSIILNEQRKKLSKRDGDVSCTSFKAAGFLPDALLNYIALLGWNAKTEQEIFTLPELIAAFDLRALNAASPVFDYDKLRWVNTQHIKRLPDDELWTRLQPWIQKAELTLPEDPHWKAGALALIRPDLVTLCDAVPALTRIISDTLPLDEEAQAVLAWESSPEVIQTFIQMVETHEQTHFTTEEAKSLVKDIQAQCGVKGKQIFMPLRIAMIGCAHGFDIKLLMPLISKTQLLQRAMQCLSSAH
jgi:nondiscriminating glutamyl-tRNA synthetase